MTVVRKGFLVRFTPQMVERIDAAKGRLSRNKWLEALVARELDILAEPSAVEVGVPAAPAPDIAETGEPTGLRPFDEDDAPVADPGAEDDAPEEWWK